MKIYRTMLTAALAAAMLICLSGCSVKLNYNYDNADKYIPGDREIAEKIENIDIDYMAGNVTVKGDKMATVTVKETSKTEIDDKLKVHTWVDGSTLHVKYCAAGKGFSIKDLEKSLEITVPADVKLSDMSIDDSAGDVSVDCSAENYDIDASAGNITIVQHGESDEMEIDASAGDVDVTAESIGKLAIDISSGNMKFSADKVPEKSEIDAAAGNVEIYMPEKTDMTLKADISAEDFNSEIPFTKKGDAYIFGNGKSRMNIDASAGNINIKKK
jgi:hypothetical protein